VDVSGIFANDAFHSLQNSHAGTMLG